MANKKIIVIDDEPLILKTIERALAKIGYSVTTVGNRSDFIEQVKNGPYDLVIQDLNMKDLSSDEIRSEIARFIPDPKFLIISGSTLEESGHFLQKPFKIDDLRNMVREILGAD